MGFSLEKIRIRGKTVRWNSRKQGDDNRSAERELLGQREITDGI